MNKTLFGLRAAAVSILLGLASMATQAGTLSQVTGFTNPGNITAYKFIPSGLPSGAPIVVALHGCSQSAATEERDTGFDTLAEQYKFIVIYPKASGSCWNWYTASNIARSGGEPTSIINCLNKVKADHSADGSRVFITGLSSGGCFVNVMLATYPDKFKGGAPAAGVAYNAGILAMYYGTSASSSTLGGYVRNAYSYSGTRPTVSVWQGTSDSTVNPKNGADTVRQWCNVFGISETPTSTQSYQGSTRKTYGNGQVEYWQITGMTHGITVDPNGTDGKAGGATDTYSFDKNIWSSWKLVQRWGIGQ